MSSLKDPKVKHFMITNATETLILCTDGDMHFSDECGPLGRCARLYKTERNARKVAATYDDTRKVVEVDQWGCPWVG